MNRSDVEKEENREVADLLAALPRVEAPANFDFGVKARIASGEPKRRSALFPFLKVAVPLSLLLLVVGGFAIFYRTMPGAGGPSVANVPPQPQQDYAADPVPPSRNETESRDSAPPVNKPFDGGTEVVASVPKENVQVRRTTRPKGGVVSRDEPLMSKDQMVKRATIINPPGIPASDDGEFSVRDVLEMLGMKVEVVSGRWHVLSTAANSIAEKSGVLASDVVETINEQAIRGKEKLKGKLEAKMLTVGRGGKSIKLDLKR